VPGAGKQIDARRQVIRKLLEKRFAKVFEPEMIGEGLELPGKWKAAGKMLRSNSTPKTAGWWSRGSERLSSRRSRRRSDALSFSSWMRVP